MTTPFLKVTGGKRKLVPQIRALMPRAFKTYREPFLGGGALFFALRDEFVSFPAVLGDLNEKLITTYKVVRDDVEELINRLHWHKAKHKVGGKDHFLEIRQRNFSMSFPEVRAAEYIYINKTCFNGMYRENKSGQFNVPFGKYENPNICDEATLRAASTALQGTVLQAKSFENVLKTATRGDFVFFDSPYAPISATSNFTDFISEGFGRKDQIKLRDVAVELRKRGVSCVLSNSNAPLVLDLYKDFKIVEVEAARAINSKGAKRGKIVELLIH